MKRQCGYVVFPLQLWEHSDLTMLEKCIMVELSTYPQDVLGTTFRPGALCDAMSVDKVTLKKAISSLVKKKALLFTLDADGRKWYRPMLYEERYLTDESIVDDTPKKTAVALDYDLIARKWAEYCPTLPEIRRMTSLRKSKVRTLLNKNQASLEDLFTCFRIIGISGFLLHGKDGTWSADFDWLIRDNKGQFQKILEGGYCNTMQERLEYEKIMRGEIQADDDVYK